MQIFKTSASIKQAFNVHKNVHEHSECSSNWMHPRVHVSGLSFRPKETLRNLENHDIDTETYNWIGHREFNINYKFYIKV